MARPYLAPDVGDEAAARRSLVLAGGGMRVAYQAGALAALDQAGLRFHHVDGSSGGTINLSMVLSGLPVTEICERWRSLDPRHFVAPLSWRQYLTTLRWPGLGGGSGLRDHVFPHLGIDPVAIRASSGVTGTYNVANFATKSAEVFEHTDIDIDLLIAGISLPVLMPAVVRDGTAYTDAVWIRDSNVPEAVRRGSDEVWLVWCIGNSPSYSGGLFRQYVHMIEMAATGSLLADLGRLAADPEGARLRLHVIRPAFPLPLDPAYFFGRIDASALIDLGYQDAMRYLANPRPLTAPWTADVTHMQEPPPGVAVRLALEGPFANGAQDPCAGAALGSARGTSLRARLRLEVPLALSSAGLAASVAGDIDVPGWAGRVLVEEGHARLGARPDVSIDLSCTTPHGGLTLKMVGCPEGLAVRAYRDAGPAVVGAGILPLGAAQLTSALASISPTNVRSTKLAWCGRVEMAGAVLRALRRSDG